MKIAILGTGIVGRTLGSALVDAGHEVHLGSRSADHEGARLWAATSGERGHAGTFAEALAFTDEVVLNCTAGTASLEAVRMAGIDAFEERLVLDVANPLDFSGGMPPRITTGAGGESLGEQLQALLPMARIVKVLNTVNSDLMVEPDLVPGGHHLFICGDSDEAKERARHLLSEWFGWHAEQFLDLGGIRAARGTEAYVAFWITVMQALGTPHFSVEVHQAEG